MGRSRFGWAIGALAPWCLGVGLVVSFTASAGISTSSGGSISLLNALPPSDPADLIPPSGMTARRIAELARRQGQQGLLVRASLTLGPDGEFRTVPDEIDPKIVLKSNATKFPAPNASAKGNPFIGLRPSFDARLRQGGGFDKHAARSLLLFDRDFLAFQGFAKERPVAQARTDEPGYTPSEPHRETASPVSRGLEGTTGATMRRLVAGGPQRHFDGSTPRAGRAVALSSMTPVSGGENDIIIVSAPVGMPGAKVEHETTVAARTISRPNYAELIENAKSPAQRKCLAEAIYFEARSEPEAGQAAVAQVVLNRALSGLYPANVCGVVYQNRHRYKACQFSFACEGKSLRITEPDSWATAVRIANEVLEGRTYLSNVGGATHYHATYVRPGWSRRLEKKGKVGTHIFYKLKPGQT